MPVLAAAAAGCLVAALALDVAGAGMRAAAVPGAAGLVFLILAAFFPRRPGGDP